MFTFKTLIQRYSTFRVNKLVLFLIASLLIFSVIRFTKLYSKTTFVIVNPVNIPKTAQLAINESKQIKAVLNTDGYQWLKYSFTSPKINVDFSKEVEIIDSAYVWQPKTSYFKIASQLPNNVRLLDVASEAIVFPYNAQSQKRVPVKLNTAITFKTGYGMLNTFDITPDSVTVIASKAILDSLNYIDTDTLVLNNLKSSFTKTINLFNGSEDELKLDKTEIEVKAIVERLTEGVLQVPVTILNLPKGKQLKHFPKTVKVTFNTTLEAFKTVTVNDFEVVCDYTNANETNNYLVPRLIKTPNTVKNIRMSQQTIEYILTD